MKYSLLILAVFFFLNYEANAQPTCFTHFDITNSCRVNPDRNQFIFVGRVLSPSTNQSESDAYRKIEVEVITQLKGKLGKTMEIYVDNNCYGGAYQDNEYVFFANMRRVSGKKMLVSGEWSTELESYKPEIVEELIEDIRRTLRGEKESQLSGELIEYFVSRSEGVGTRLAYGRNGYDKDRARPLIGVTINAVDKDGRIFETKTDQRGEYVFHDLPLGDYKVFPVMPKSYTAESFGDIQRIGESKADLTIDTAKCSKFVAFLVQERGGIEGTISHINEKFPSTPLLFLLKVNPNTRDMKQFNAQAYRLENLTKSQNGDHVDINFALTGIPVGHYVVFIEDPSSPRRPQKFYPGVEDINKAEIIEVMPLKSAKFIINLDNHLTKN